MLIRSVGTKRIPVPGVVAEVRRLKESGATLYLWSSGGAEYALASARELGIEDCFVPFLPKPDVVIDDQPIAEWRTIRHVHPMQAHGATRHSSRRGFAARLSLGIRLRVLPTTT